MRLQDLTPISFSKEVPVIEVDVSIGGARVCRILDRLFTTRPVPATFTPTKGEAIIGGESTGKMPRTSWRLISTGRQSPDTDEDASLDMMDDGEWYGPLEQPE